MTNAHSPAPMEGMEGDVCTRVKRHLPAYLDGTLDAATASGMEAHAAVCPVCEELLAAATVRTVSYEPTPSMALRDATLRAVADRRRMHQWRRGGMMAALAAAAVFMITLVARHDAQGPAGTVLADSGRMAAHATPERFTGSVRAAVGEAEALANAQAASEFSALDAAMQELDAALVATPDDAELRLFRSTIRTRRDELERRVRDAAS